jgi:hypothetical protein
MEHTLEHTTATPHVHNHGGGEPICVRVWRCVEGLPKALFSFTGPVDAPVLRAVLQQVERLVRSLPGGGHVEVIASPLDAGLLQEAVVALRDLQRGGVPASLALLGVRRTTLMAVPSLLLH